MAANKIQVGYIEPQDGAQFKVDEGTAAAPGICFVDSAATGLYSPGTGQLAFSTSSKQTALRILADGKVGIDCSPTVALEVNGTIKATAIDAPIEGTLDDWIVHAGDTNTKIGFPGNDQFEIHAGGGPKVHVNSSGYVGIGTSTMSNAERLAVQLANDEMFELRSAAQELFQVWKEGSTEECRLNVKHGGATKIHIRGNGASYFNGGKVGIGEASPDEMLHINSGTANGCLKLESTDAQADLYIVDNSGQVAISANGDNLLFQNTSSQTERIRIDASGRLLIHGGSFHGSTMPHVGDAALQVYTSDNKHPAIKTDSSGSNGYAMIADAYQADESQVNIGVSYSSAKLVLSTSVKVSPTADDAFISSQDTFAARPCVFQMNHQGVFQFLNTNTNATTTTDSVVNGITEKLRIKPDGEIIIGGADRPVAGQRFNSASGWSGILQIEKLNPAGGNNNIPMLAITAWNAANEQYTGGISFNRSSNNTNGTQGAVNPNQQLGNIAFNGSDGTNFIQGAEIFAIPEQTFATNDGPTSLVFGTVPDGTSETRPVERLRIAADGELRQTGSSSGLGQGDIIAKYTHHTLDPTTPGGAGEVFKIYTYSANANGADYSTWLYKRAGSAGGECGIRLGGSADGSLNFYTSPNSSTAHVERLKIDSTGGVIIGTGNDSNTMSEFGSNTGGLTIDDAGVSNTGLRLSHGADDTYLVQSSNGNFYMSAYTDNDMIFGVGTSGNDRMRLVGSGSHEGSLFVGTNTGVNAHTNANDIVVGTTSSGKRTGITIVSASDQDGMIHFSDGTGAGQYVGQINYYHDDNAFRFYTAGDKRWKLCADGQIVHSMSGHTNSPGATSLSHCIVQTGGYQSTYPGLHMKSLSSGGGNGIGIYPTDSNFDLYTRSGNRSGIALSASSTGASSGEISMYIGEDDKVCCGPETFGALAGSRTCNTAFHVAGGGISIGPESDASNAVFDQAGRYTLGWYGLHHSSGGSYYHVKTDLWGGGSPHGNSEYIMGGFIIHSYGYSQGVAVERIFFHNWSNTFHGKYVCSDNSGWAPGAHVYISSDGYVCLRTASGQYISHIIDVMQIGSHYGVRDIKVTATSSNNNSSHY